VLPEAELLAPVDYLASLLMPAIPQTWRRGLTFTAFYRWRPATTDPEVAQIGAAVILSSSHTIIGNIAENTISCKI